MTEPSQAVFLSYASEDAPAAQRIAAALRAASVEVWFDQTELRGGDMWDQRIRREIRDCALFIPIVSQHTQERLEGYFRREWKLAIERTHDMAEQKHFLVPVVVDSTGDRDAIVPDLFRAVQWTRLPGGETPPAFVERIKRLLSPDIAGFLPGEAAVARPDSAAYRARKFAARRRAAVAGVSVLVIAALGLAGLFSRPYLFHPRNIIAYSPEDRRMTFAILPFQAPRGDPIAQTLAISTFEVMATAFDDNNLWGQVAPRRSVDEALGRFSRVKDIATALDVHFLIRGTIAKPPPDYTVNVLLIDGASERVLGARSFLLRANVARPRHVDVVDTFFGMVNLAAESEVKRAVDKPPDALDVRDLSLRAYSEWLNHPGAQAKLGYTSATELLKRALQLAPGDLYATYLTVKINLCDCVLDWSSNVEEQRAIGAAALERFLGADPSNLVALKFKVLLLLLRGRFEESLVIADTILQREPDEASVLDWKVAALQRLGRPREAQPIADALASEVPDKWPGLEASAANIHYALGDYAAAAQLARGAIARMSEAGLRNPVTGTIRLTLVAAEARLGHTERAAAALADFQGSVPKAKTVADIRSWMNPLSVLYGFQPLFDGLRLAGVPD